MTDGTSAAAVTIAALRGFAPAGDESSQRIAEFIKEYDSQGYHRTATDVDNRSARWLLEKVKHLGVLGSLESFALDRIDPATAYVQFGDRRISGVSLFDGAFTAPRGIMGRLGPLGSDTEIALLTYDIGVGEAARKLAEIRRTTRCSALVVITHGGREGLSLNNAPSFLTPFGPPVLQASSTDEKLLTALATEHAEVSVVAAATRASVDAYNVTAHVSGANTTLAPVFVGTPRSGWWHCAAERGGGLACWLEIMRTVQRSKPLRTVQFIASSGHELGFLGMNRFLERHPDSVEAAAWVFFGANIGAAAQPDNLLQASDDHLESTATQALERAHVSIQRRMARPGEPSGEVSVIARAGGRFVAIIGANPLFHNVADRWPAAVDVGAVARNASAFVEVVQTLSRKAPTGRS